MTDPVGGFIRDLERTEKRLDGLATQFLTNLIRAVTDFAAWLEEVGNHLVAFSKKLFPPVWRVMVAGSKIAAFYLPSIVCGLIGLSAGGLGWFMAAAVFALLITVIGLGYREGTTKDSFLPEPRLSMPVDSYRTRS